jgi:hypothetical protein
MIAFIILIDRLGDMPDNRYVPYLGFCRQLPEKTRLAAIRGER